MVKGRPSEEEAIDDKSKVEFGVELVLSWGLRSPVGWCPQIE